jgi:hypothetical protein
MINEMNIALACKIFQQACDGCPTRKKACAGLDYRKTIEDYYDK